MAVLAVLAELAVLEAARVARGSRGHPPSHFPPHLAEQRAKAVSAKGWGAAQVSRAATKALDVCLLHEA